MQLNDWQLWGFFLHVLFMLATLVGVVLLIVWMAKNLKGKQLLTWTLVVLVVGLLGSLLTLQFKLFHHMTSDRSGAPEMMDEPQK